MTSRLIVIFLTMIGITAGVFFVLDLQGHYDNVDDPIAQISEASGIVKRLPKDALSWNQAGMATLFAKGDLVSTSEGARAVVRILDPPSELILEEGAMVELGGNSESLSLNFVQGSGKVRATEEAISGVPTGSRAGAKKLVIARIERGAVQKQGNRSEISRAPPPDIVIEKVTAQELQAPPARQVASIPVSSASSFSRELSKASQIKSIEIKNPEQGLKTDGRVIAMRIEPQKIQPPVEILSVLEIFRRGIRVEEGFPVELSWSDRESGYEKFEVLYRSKPTTINEKIPPSRVEVSDQKFVLSDLKSGLYEWSVRGIKSDGRRGPLAQTALIEVHPKPAPAPQIAPKVKILPVIVR